MSDHAPLDRETTIRAVALSVELIMSNPDRAVYLLNELLHRLVSDEAIEHRDEVARDYGPEIVRQ